MQHVFPTKIKQLRKNKGWSQQELAEKIGTDARQISRYETGKITPSIDVVIRIAKIFEVSIDYLLVKENNIKAPENLNEALGQFLKLQALSGTDQKLLFQLIDRLSKS
ncbi:MAG: hypothetical protein K0S07_761 [Chlamydiales bacterium]|jgi:transcriptional regulator with XRE-family HTH domain|nr:hypothetical protein [Chlamydiales bacterium]